MVVVKLITIAYIAFFFFAGLNHFINPNFYDSIVPNYIPFPIYLKDLDDKEKELFKTANEINQIWIVEHAYKRQEFVCQSQSVNLFFVFPKATEPQEIHDEYLQYVNDVHWYAMHTLKSLYYFRSDAARTAENVNIKIPRIRLEEVDCIACEG